jgi:hypothetical protein
VYHSYIKKVIEAHEILIHIMVGHLAHHQVTLLGSLGGFGLLSMV